MSNLDFRSHQSYNERIHDNLESKISNIGAGIFLPNPRQTISVVGPTTLTLTPEQSGTTVLCQTGGGTVTINLPIFGMTPPSAGVWYHINKDTALNTVVVDSQIPFTGIVGRSIITVPFPYASAPIVPISAQTVTGTAVGDNITIFSNGVSWYIVGVASGFV
jgi:hypothetical protein